MQRALVSHVCHQLNFPCVDVNFVAEVNADAVSVLATCDDNLIVHLHIPAAGENLLEVFILQQLDPLSQCVLGVVNDHVV